MNGRTLPAALFLSLCAIAAPSAQPAPSGSPVGSATAVPQSQDAHSGETAAEDAKVHRASSADSRRSVSAAEAPAGGRADAPPAGQPPLASDPISPENSYLIEISTRSLKLGRTFGAHSVYLSFWLQNHSGMWESRSRDYDTSAIEDDEGRYFYGDYRIGIGYDKIWTCEGFDAGLRSLLEYEAPYSLGEVANYYETKFSVISRLAVTLSRRFGPLTLGGAFGPDARWTFRHSRSGSIDSRYYNNRSHRFVTEFAGELFVQVRL